MLILGINVGHDSTAVLMEGGRVVAAIAEERLTRVKFHNGFPFAAVGECLRIVNASARDVTEVALSFASNLTSPTYVTRSLLDPEIAARWDLVESLPPQWRFGMVAERAKRLALPRNTYWRNRSDASAGLFRSALNELGLTRAELRAYDHHLCHAASAVYTSGFEDCLVVTVDGGGDGLCATASIATEGRIERVAATPVDFSPGDFYGAVTTFLGFRRLRHEGKITGLAAYGDPARAYDVMAECLSVSGDSSEFRGLVAGGKDKAAYYTTLPARLVTNRYRDLRAHALEGHLHRHLDGVEREHVAAAAQRRLEDIVVDHIRALVASTGRRHVALAGGVFGNVRVNQRIAEETGAERVFIHPNMGDGGTALGAAAVAFKARPEGSDYRGERIENVYWGPGYDDAAIAAAARRLSLPLEQDPELEATVAEAVADGSIVGWFEGRMEYGPRALGARSILASATDRTINDWLNQRLKRTEFMPFAPVVLDHAAADVFKNYEGAEHPATFMTITFDVFDTWGKRAPAVTHVDGTARPQVIERSQNPRYYKILEEYERRTGLPLLINTSFNVHEEPIVCTPEDAMRSLITGSVDLLAIGSFLMRRPQGSTAS